VKDVDDFSGHRIEAQLRVEFPTTAVLVVDMLNDFIDEAGAMPLPIARQLYGPIRDLLGMAREGGATVFWLNDCHEPGDTEFRKRTPHCIAGTWGAQVVEELRPPAGEAHLPKTRYSGFYCTDLEDRLTSAGAKQLVIVGIATNICVRSTVHDAFFRDFDVVVPSDCVSATSEREQASTLYDIDTHYGTVCNLGELLAARA
jgi:ureidoacrylate peracid hydrolase